MMIPPEQILSRKHPNEPAIIDERRVLSWKETEETVQTCMHQLNRLGIKRGKRVAIISANTTEYLILLLALWRNKNIACPLSVRLPVDNIAQYIRKLQCEWIFTDLLNYRRLKKLSTKEILIPTFVKSEKEKFLPTTKSRISLKQPATMILTSGSTAEPKAALHSYGNHYFNAKGANENMPLSPGDRWLLALPLYHVGGIGIFFRALLSGAAVVIPSENKNILKTISRYRITHVSLVPTQLLRIIKKNSKVLKNLKAILLGGSAAVPGLVKKSCQLKLPIYLTYGLTEMTSQVATGTAQAPLRPKVLHYREIKIASDNEILVKGKTLFQGYRDGKRLKRPLPKGWFATGDLGRLDSQGRLTVTGRKDNMFISGGENIQPEEIEGELLRLPGIEQAVVVPVADHEFGFRPAAFLKTNRDFQPEKIRKLLMKSLPGFKIPVVFHRLSEDKKNPGLKISREELRQKIKKP